MERYRRYAKSAAIMAANAAAAAEEEELDHPGYIRVSKRTRVQAAKRTAASEIIEYKPKPRPTHDLMLKQQQLYRERQAEKRKLRESQDKKLRGSNNENNENYPPNTMKKSACIKPSLPCIDDLCDSIKFYRADEQAIRKYRSEMEQNAADGKPMPTVTAKTIASANAAKLTAEMNAVNKNAAKAAAINNNAAIAAKTVTTTAARAPAEIAAKTVAATAARTVAPIATTTTFQKVQNQNNEKPHWAKPNSPTKIASNDDVSDVVKTDVYTTNPAKGASIAKKPKRAPKAPRAGSATAKRRATDNFEQLKLPANSKATNKKKPGPKTAPGVGQMSAQKAYTAALNAATVAAKSPMTQYWEALNAYNEHLNRSIASGQYVSAGAGAGKGGVVDFDGAAAGVGAVAGHAGAGAGIGGVGGVGGVAGRGTPAGVVVVGGTGSRGVVGRGGIGGRGFGGPGGSGGGGSGGGGVVTVSAVSGRGVGGAGRGATGGINGVGGRAVGEIGILKPPTTPSSAGGRLISPRSDMLHQLQQLNKPRMAKAAMMRRASICVSSYAQQTGMPTTLSSPNAGPLFSTIKTVNGNHAMGYLSPQCMMPPMGVSSLNYAAEPVSNLPEPKEYTMQSIAAQVEAAKNVTKPKESHEYLDALTPPFVSKNQKASKGQSKVSKYALNSGNYSGSAPVTFTKTPGFVPNILAQRAQEAALNNLSLSRPGTVTVTPTAVATALLASQPTPSLSSTVSQVTPKKLMFVKNTPVKSKVPAMGLPNPATEENNENMEFDRLGTQEYLKFLNANNEYNFG